MPVTCIDEPLVRRALGDSAVDATLLIQAFSGLCPPQATVVNNPTVEPFINRFADHWGTVSVAYVCGFLPWGIIVLLDFISAKWKSVRRTRYSGYLHLVGGLAPTVIVAAYACLQGLAKDFKEMMTAVIALFLTFYHVGRTIWGLAQLRAYRAWCADALACIRALVSYEDDEDDEDLLDVTLLANSGVVDNEFSGRDVSVGLDWRNMKLSMRNAELCTVRWSAAFLCSLGHELDLNLGMMRHRFVSLTSKIVWFISYCTLPLRGKHGETNCVSIRQLSTLHTGAFGSDLENVFTVNRYRFGAGSLDVYKFDLESTVSSFSQTDDWPAQHNREHTDLSQVYALLFAMQLGPDKLKSLRAARHPHVPRKGQRLELDWELFVQQICVRGDKEATYGCFFLHPIWNLFTIPLWECNHNRNVLQASAHVDINVALQEGCHDSQNRTERLITDSQNVFEASRQRAMQSRTFYTMQELDEHSLGVALDAVRTILAKWAFSTHQSLLADSWKPSLSDDEFTFTASDYVCGCDFRYADGSGHGPAFPDYNYEGMRIVWECQQALQSSLVANEPCDDGFVSPSCSRLIMLFLCAYPVSKVSNAENDPDLRPSMEEMEEPRQVKIDLMPWNVPQDIRVRLQVDQESGKARMKLAGDAQTQHFNWEHWINAAMGLLKGRGERVQEKRGEQKFERLLWQIKPVNLTRPFLKLSPPHSELRNLPGELAVWTGWPMFDTRICQFEMDQWIATCPDSENEESVISSLSSQAAEDAEDAVAEEQEEISSDISRAQEVFVRIASWDRA